MQMTIDALPTSVVILNSNRQIVGVNRSLLQMLNVDASEVIGKRPGEILGCTYPVDGSGGCGTTKHCLACGAVAAIMESQQSRSRATRECRLTLATASDGGARDLRVTATALDVDDEPFTVCTIQAQVGRGIGTYSMKLLGEHYLRGQVDFTSDEANGTIFTITLPRRFSH